MTDEPLDLRDLIDQEIAVGRDHVENGRTWAVSNSEIQVWMGCHRRWYLEYYRELGLKDRPVVGALAFGSRVHLALERRYMNGENPLDVYEECHDRAIFDLLQQEHRTGWRDDKKREKLQKERELAHAMLTGYVAWAEETGVDEDLELAGVEVVVEVASGVEGMRIRGKLDQRVYRKIDSARLFRDFKTAANLNDGPAYLPLDEQMKFYIMLERLDALAKSGDEPPEPTMGGLYLMLKKVKRTERAKPPFYSQVEVHHNNRAIESMWIRTQKRLEEIKEVREQLDAGGDHRYWVYPRPTRDCKWNCPFLPVCPVMDEAPPETWNALLDNYYTHRDPHERYRDDETKA